MLMTGYIKSIRYGLDTDLDRICDMYRSLENMRHEPVRSLSDRDIDYIQGKLNRVLDYYPYPSRKGLSSHRK